MNGAIEGQAPSMPVGLDQGVVAATICDAIAGAASGLPSAAFGP
ncbi:MAG: hypothetical protein ACI8Y4_004853 [Candidatus Poriferisodalaceae bacterium]|jgi:hypothetical protein